MRQTFGVILALVIWAGGALAATQTFQATIENVQGSADLLAEVGILSGGTLTATFTIEVDQSVPTDLRTGFDQRLDTYVAFELDGIATAPAANASDHRLFTRDAEPGQLAKDTVQISSNPRSTDPAAFFSLSLTSSATPESWDRSAPITADLLNGFTDDRFSFIKYIGTTQASLSSNKISYVAVPTVPLPASAVFLLTGLGIMRIRWLWRGAGPRSAGA
ncbi:MAG: hypothetical protein AAGF79_00555 [Pseudomonadota bacterium]